MPLLIVLIALLAALVLFVQQNWSPSLALVFLGNSTKPLPLALWMLGAFVLGTFTTVILSGLIRFAGYQIAQELAESDEVDEPPRPPSTPRQSASKRYSRAEDDDDDWADEDWVEDAEDRASAPSPTSRVAPRSSDDDRPEPAPQDSVREQSVGSTSTPKSLVDPPKDYERSQQPQRSTQDGSAYSYSYRESARSGVGKAEAVYDAEFRVLIPPHNPTTPDESGSWTQNAPQIPEPEDEEEVWDEAEDEDWSGSSDRNDDWAEDDTSSLKRH